MYRLGIFFILFCAFNFSPPVSSLTVELDNVRFDKGGTLYIMVLDRHENAVYQTTRLLKENNTVFEIKNLTRGGEYAIKVYHDQNNNGQLDTGIFGQPVEGWGVSNDVRGFMSAPPFKKMLVKLNQPARINIKISY